MLRISTVKPGLTVLDTGAALGESPWWSVAEQALYWVDALAPSVGRFRPATGAHHVWPMPERIGCVAGAEAGRVIVALASGVALLDTESGALGPLHRPAELTPELRFNDGKCDAAGRFWAGAHFGGEPRRRVGLLFRFGADLAATLRETGIGISNGLGWSPDRRVLYYADTLARRIYAYDFDLATGANTSRRVFAVAGASMGVPDGLTVDSEGHVWCAFWDGWCVRRYAPDGGLDRVIGLPVQRPTSCMFGGPDLRTLYVTSASDGVALARQPLAGGIFALEVDVPGLPEPVFGGAPRE